MSIEYAIIVRNKTRLEILTERFNTKAQARFYIERSGGDFHDYEREHEVFHSSLSGIQRELTGMIRNKIIDRSFLPSFLFSENQFVITIGQDGLVANTAKYASAIPIIAVNPDPERYDGILLPFNAGNFTSAVSNVIHDTYKSRLTSFAEAKLNDGQRLLAFNDLFIGANSHVSARYRISFRDQTEEHSSSGIIVSTHAGSTGWLSSVMNMAGGISGFIKNATPHLQVPDFSEEDLLFAVREPFASKKSQTGIVAGKISLRERLTLESHMPTNGVIFSDGIEADFLHFNSGSIASIGLAPEKARLVLPG